MRRALLPLVAICLIAVACGTPPDPRVDVGAQPRPTTPATDPPPVLDALPLPPPVTAPDPHRSYVAQSKLTGDHPDHETVGGPVLATLTNPNRYGAPLVFLVKELDGPVDPEGEQWLEVYLPIRPNGSTGFVQRSEIELTEHRWHIEVSLSEYTLEVFEGDELFLEAPIAVAKDNTPTPDGLYFTTELIQPTNEAGVVDPGGPYGHWAYGLSGYSEVLQTFNGGPGQLGIHGTNEPELIGQQVSSGCIRLRNEDIDRLQPLLPLGVPVTVSA